MPDSTCSSIEEYEKAWRDLQLADSRRGTVEHLVTRAPSSAGGKERDKNTQPIHDEPREFSFTVEEGIEGDRWRPGKLVGSQVSIMNVELVKLIAGAKERWHLFGDNVIATLPLDALSAPVGTRLQLGSGEIMLSDDPHKPCERFKARFGAVAHDWVMAHSFDGRHLRGRLAQVTKSGVVRVGDSVVLMED